MKKGSAMFEGSVAGSGSIIGESASLKPNVLVWPGKIIGAGVIVSSNVKYGNMRTDFMNDNGIDNRSGVVLNAETCVKLGYAISSSENGKKVGIACDSSKKSSVMKTAVSVGLADGGNGVWDFGECFEAQLDFLVNFCGLDSGVFVSNHETCRISLCGEHGMSVSRGFEREIEGGMNRCEFRSVSEKTVKEISDMSGIKLLYEQELIKSFRGNFNGLSAVIKCTNDKISDLLGSCFVRFGATEKTSTVFEIDYSGKRVFAETENGTTEYEKLLAICCCDELRKGRDVAVPYTSPDYFDYLAKEYGRRILRYTDTPIDNSDENTRILASKQMFSRDSLFMCVKLLSIMNERQMTLDMLAAELPEKYIEKKMFAVNFPPSKLASLMEDEAVSSREGIKLVRKEGSLLVIPEKGGGFVKVFAEADTMEAARELCADIEEKIKSVSSI